MARLSTTILFSLLTTISLLFVFHNIKQSFNHPSNIISSTGSDGSGLFGIDDPPFPSQSLTDKHNSQNYHHKSTKEDFSQPEKYAYASLLCDDGMKEAVLVTLSSLLATKTKHPILLLILPEVTQTSDLEKLSSIYGGSQLKIIRIEKLDYPFPINAEKLAINKPCRYSKLQIWRFTEYKKVVFLDLDLVIMQVR